MFRVTVAALLALASCGRSRGVPDEDLGNLVKAPADNATPVKVARAASVPAELSRALTQSLTTVVSALGPHTVKVATSTTIDEAGAVTDDLKDETVIEIGAQDAFHGLYTNTADYGREVIFVGGTMYLRPRYQKWHGRAPEGSDEPAQQRDSFYTGVAATWDLLAPGVELIDKGAVNVAGRPGRKIQIEKAPKAGTNPAEKLTQRKWRETRVVEDVSGEVVLDVDKGVPLSVQLAGTITFMREGRRFKMKTSVTSTVLALAMPDIAAPVPEEVVSTPGRLREVEERDELLKGIAPPQRKVETTTGSQPGATK